MPKSNYMRDVTEETDSPQRNGDVQAVDGKELKKEERKLTAKSMAKKKVKHAKSI